MQRELKELKAFELLEQAAEDSSFCSNSSFVSNLLHAASSTPERRPGAPVPLSPLAKEMTAPAPAPATATATVTARPAAIVTTAGNLERATADGHLTTNGNAAQYDITEEKAAEISEETPGGISEDFRRIPDVSERGALGPSRRAVPPAAGPMTHQATNPRPSTVVRPNVATARSDWSLPVVTSQPGRSDWSVSAAVSEASRRLPAAPAATPYARAPDSDIPTSPSLIGSPLRAAGSGALGAPRDVRDSRDGERDASAASSDSDLAPEERLERYRRLRDQMRLELERCEPGGTRQPDVHRLAPPLREVRRPAGRVRDHGRHVT